MEAALVLAWGVFWTISRFPPAEGSVAVASTPWPSPPIQPYQRFWLHLRQAIGAPKAAFISSYGFHGKHDSLEALSRWAYVEGSFADIAR